MRGNRSEIREKYRRIYEYISRNPGIEMGRLKKKFDLPYLDSGAMDNYGYHLIEDDDHRLYPLEWWDVLNAESKPVPTPVRPRQRAQFSSRGYAQKAFRF